MNYIVMECSKGRAVLMDEAGRFVFAANLGYEVGQSVTNPVLLEDTGTKNSRIIVMRIAAAAACLALLAVPGYSYYARNLKACSAVTISSHAGISMELNRDGKVIRLQSDTDYGKQLIAQHEIKGKDKVEAANEILQSEITDGYLADGDTVDVYIDSKNDEEFHSYKTEFEAELPKLDIKVNVHEKDKDKPTPHEDKKDKDKVKPEKPDAPTPPDPGADKPDPPIAPTPKPVETPTPPEQGEKPEPPISPQTPAQPQEGELPKPEKPEKPEITENPEKPAKPEKPEKPEKPVTPENPENPEQTPPYRNGWENGEKLPEPTAPMEKEPHNHPKPHQKERPMQELPKPAHEELPAKAHDEAQAPLLSEQREHP